MTYLKLYRHRHAISVTGAVFIALMTSVYFATGQFYWIIAAAFLVSLTSRGTPIRQGAFYLLAMVAAIILAAIFNVLYAYPYFLALIVATIFILLSLFIITNQPINPHRQFLLLIFFATLMMAMLLPLRELSLSDCLMQLLMGGTIGIVMNRFVLPAHLYQEFSQGVVPILQALHDYEAAVHDYFAEGNGKTIVTHKKILMEKALIAHESAYPEWVYESGFNPGLRAGYRFFLIQLEHMTELFFSIDYFVNRGLDFSLLDKIKQPLSDVWQKNNELLTALIHYFKTHKVDISKDNYANDLLLLEKIVKEVIPVTIELIDISPDYVSFATFIQDVKDLRRILLQLAAALPTSSQ